MKLSLMQLFENKAESAKDGKMLAVFPPKSISEYLSKFAGKWEGDPVDANDMHVTIGLIEHEDDDDVIKIVRQIARHLSPMMISVPRLAIFPPSEGNDHHHILHARVESEDLQGVHDLVFKRLHDDGININNGNFDWSPHLTIKYCREEPELNKFKNISFPVDSIYFVSHNKKYRFKMGS